MHITLKAHSAQVKHTLYFVSFSFSITTNISFSMLILNIFHLVEFSRQLSCGLSDKFFLRAIDQIINVFTEKHIQLCIFFFIFSSKSSWFLLHNHEFYGDAIFMRFSIYSLILHISQDFVYICLLIVHILYSHFIISINRLIYTLSRYI